MVDRPLMASLTDVYTGERVMLSSRFTSRTVACGTTGDLGICFWISAAGDQRLICLG